MDERFLLQAAYFYLVLNNAVPSDFHRGGGSKVD